MSLLDDVSIVVTPNGYKAGELYAVIPSNGDADMDVTRATDATRVDENGLIEDVLSNVPRIDYTGGGCPHILAEPQRTNLVTYSEDFSDSSWTKSRSTFTSDSIQSPSGLINMGYLTEDTTANNTHYMRDFLTVTDGVNYTLSVFAKAKERDIICLGDNAAAQSSTGVWFDLTNGLVLTQRSGYVGSIKDFGNGIYRCSVTYSTSASRQYVDIALSLSDGVNVYTGDGTSGAYFWGAQLEEGSYATSYIPTSGSTVTRNQDIFTRDGIGSLINSTEGVLFIEFKTLSETGTFRQFNLSKDNSNRIYITKRGDSGNLEFRMENPSGNLNFSFAENTTNDFVKVAFRYGLNNFAVFIDGVNKNVTSTGNVFASGTLNTLEFNSPLSQPFFGKVKQLQVYDTALTDDQLEDLTS